MGLVRAGPKMNFVLASGVWYPRRVDQAEGSLGSSEGRRGRGDPCAWVRLRCNGRVSTLRNTRLPNRQACPQPSFLRGPRGQEGRRNRSLPNQANEYRSRTINLSRR